MPRLAPLALLVTGLGFVALAAPAPARADDQDRARQAVERGEIRPLDEVLKAARSAVPGEVVKLDLKRDDGRWLYELKILTPEGRRHDVKIDAASLKVLDADDDDDDD